MKTIITAFLTLAITSFAFAQNPDKVLARVTYNFNHIQDTTQKERPYTETMLLIVGKNAVLKINGALSTTEDLENEVIKELVYDLSQIAHVSIATDASEDDEHNYAELVEYIRVAVQSIQLELKEVHKSKILH